MDHASPSTQLLLVKMYRIMFYIRLFCVIVCLNNDLIYSFITGNFHIDAPVALLAVVVCVYGITIVRPGKLNRLRTWPWVIIDGITAGALYAVEDASVMALLYICLAMVILGGSLLQYFPIFCGVVVALSFTGLYFNYLSTTGASFLNEVLKQSSALIVVLGCAVLGTQVMKVILSTQLSWELYVAEQRVLAETQERLATASDLHDSVSKDVYGSVMLAEALVESLRAEGSPQLEAAEHLLEGLEHAQDNSRSLLADLRSGARRKERISS
ncbi:MAG: histidine kinase dimerization/phosphoacceptor domain-containing protein [Propionibacteriaceae bacterium]|jgi:signal transduction histidine kinase|nr:histidine kinase dimerization/phosphoacceptor domain-containing protein [Propionibacteriaceae bacterium]